MSKISNTIPSTPSYKPPNAIENLISNVKAKTSKDLKIYLAVAIPVLILLIYAVYKYNFFNRTTNVISSLDYTSTVTSNIAPLQNCFEIDVKKQYKLCDYLVL